MNEELRFVREWSLDTEIPWQLEGRKKLNEIIQIYNTWQIDGSNATEAPRLVRLIRYGIDTFASRPGTGEWREELEGMKRFVESKMRPQS